MTINRYAIRTSPVVQGEDGGFTATGDFGSGFDVDPNLDPELALALRVSMEEQRQRQEDDNKQEKSDAMVTDTPAADTTTAAPSNEDALLMNAINSLGTGDSVGSGPDYSSMTEDEQIALAIQMSMAESSTDLPTQTPETTTEAVSAPSAMETEPSSTIESMEEIPDYSAVMSDPAFLQHLVGSLPGVDPNSEAIQNALQALTGGHEEKK